MMGLAVAWGLYVFSGAISKTTLLSVSMTGAGVGAGLGAFFAWLRLDHNPLRAAAVTLLLALLVGVVGGWAGYQYGANKEIECCALPETAPFTYTAFGATLAANGIVLLLQIGRDIFPRIGWLISGRT
jgi:hypothetical protein